MAKYRKKPVIIDAFKLGDNIPDWFMDKVTTNDIILHRIPFHESRARNYGQLWCEIKTLEGVMEAYEGKDYIIKGVDGEIYPCKIDIFEKTYEFVKDDKYEEPTEIWSWNEMDNENWSHGVFYSREEAIEDALADIENVKRILCTDTPTIYLGKCEYIPLRTDLDPDRAMEYLDEAYCDDSGCDYYIYEGVTDEQRQWLEDKLSDVMVEFHKMIGLNPCWFRVVEQEEIDLCEYEKEKK